MTEPSVAGEWRERKPKMMQANRTHPMIRHNEIHVFGSLCNHPWFRCKKRTPAPEAEAAAFRAKQGEKG